jgi:hypothetical protein
MPIVDVDDEEVVGRPAVVKQAGSRAKDFTGDFDNELVADLFVALLTLVVDIDPALILCVMWFNSQTTRVPRSRPSPVCIPLLTSPSALAIMVCIWPVPSHLFRRVIAIRLIVSHWSTYGQS